VLPTPRALGSSELDAASAELERWDEERPLAGDGLDLRVPGRVLARVEVTHVAPADEEKACLCAARALRHLGRLEEAVALLGSAMRTTPTAPLALERALDRWDSLGFYRTMRIEDALRRSLAEVHDDLVRTVGTDAHAAWLRDALWPEGSVDALAARASALAAADPERALLRTRLVADRRLLGDEPAAAAARYEEVLARRPRTPYALHGASIAHGEAAFTLDGAAREGELERARLLVGTLHSLVPGCGEGGGFAGTWLRNMETYEARVRVTYVEKDGELSDLRIVPR
jgi:hypothetical protein